MTAPALAAKTLGLYPPPSDASEAGKQVTSISKQEHQRVSASMALLAARDISIGLALFAFDYQDKPHAMGTLILSGMVLCVTDVYYVFKLRGWEWAALMGVGAGFWCFVGSGLVGL